MNAEKTKSSDVLLIQRANSNGHGLFIESWNYSDRYNHAIGLVIDGQKIKMIESCEGDSDQAWPPSPPLQQVYKQDIDGDPAILGVGMAGKSHFSSSFLLQDVDTIALAVDSACLVKDDQSHLENELPFLGTTYQKDSQVRFVFSNNGQNIVSIQHENHSDVTLQMFTDGEMVSCDDAAGLRIFPKEYESKKATQWNYRIRLLT